MNATYTQISTVDAAKMLGVDKTTVSNWCRNGIIEFSDVSGPNSTIPRYVLTEETVDRIKRARKKYGKQEWSKHYKKKKENIITQQKNVVDDSYLFVDNPSPTLDEPVSTTKDNLEVRSSTEPKSSKIDADKITNTIMYIRDIKERLEDLEAEKAQLVNELESLRQEVLEYI